MYALQYHVTYDEHVVDLLKSPLGVAQVKPLRMARFLRTAFVEGFQLFFWIRIALTALNRLPCTERATENPHSVRPEA